MPEILLFVYCFIHISSKFQAACFVLFFVQRKDLNISVHFNFFFGDGRLNITSNLWGDNPAYPNNAPGSDPSEFVPWRHQKQVNILYGDGHAASRRVSPEIRVTTNEGKLFWNGQQ